MHVLSLPIVAEACLLLEEEIQTMLGSLRRGVAAAQSS